MANSRRIEVVLVGDEKALTASLGRASAQVNSFAGRMNRVGKSITSAGHTLTRNLTLPLAAAGGAAIKTAADFDASLSKIQGLVGANTEEMAQYRKSILALAPAVAQGPKALADALYFVTSSGFKGAAALRILAVSARASTAGLGETQQIADLVTSAITAYGAKTLSAAHATDILVAATKAGKGDPQQFAQALQLNVAAADTLGISFDQLAAATAALSTVNSNVSEDATQLSGIMTALIKPSAGAREELHKLGLSAAELRAEVRDKGLLDTLLDLQKRTNGNVDAIGKLFPNVRGLRGFLTLVGTAAQRNVSIFDQVAKSTGSLNKAFATALTQNPEVQWKKLTAQLQVAAIVIGEQLIPVALELTGWIVSAASAFKGLSPEMQTAVLLAAGFLAVIGPIVGVVGAIITVISGAAAAFTALAAGELLAAAPIVLITIGILAIAAALVIAYKRSATFRSIVQTALHAVEAAAQTLLAGLRSLAPVFDFMKMAATVALRGLVVEIGVVVAAVRLMAAGFVRVKNIGVAAFHVVGSAISGVIGVAKSVYGVIQSIVSAIQDLVHAAESAKNFLGQGSGIIGPQPIHPGAHAMGGYARTGSWSLVGERGPELRYEGSSAHYKTAGQTRQMLGGGDTYNLIFPNASIVDAKTIDHAARLLAPRIRQLNARAAGG